MSGFLALKLIHVLAMAIWIGGGIGYPRDVAESLGVEARPALVRRLQRASRVFIPAGFVTLLSGIALMLLAGGFSQMPLRIRLALPLTIAIFPVGGLVVNPVIVRLKNAGELAAGEQRRLARRFRLGITIEQIAKLIVLSLMVLPI
jgi:putative copper export protein